MCTELYRTPHGDLAVGSQRVLSGAHRYTLVLPTAVSGRRAVPLLHGRVAVGGPATKGVAFDAVASHDDRDLILIDLSRGVAHHLEPSGGIAVLDPGFGLVVTGDEATFP